MRMVARPSRRAVVLAASVAAGMASLAGMGSMSLAQAPDYTLPEFVVQARDTPRVEWDPAVVRNWADSAHAFLDQRGASRAVREEVFKLALDLEEYLAGPDTSAIRALVSNYLADYPTGEFADLFRWKDAFYRVKVWEYGEAVAEPVSVARSYERFLQEHPTSRYLPVARIEAARAWMNAIVALRDFPDANDSYTIADAQDFAARAHDHARKASVESDEHEVIEEARDLIYFIDRELESFLPIR